MKNFLIVLVFAAFISTLIFIGASISDEPENKVAETTASPAIPYLGNIELLNGCGIDGAAKDVADYLRSHSFDVKSIGNASMWNYSSTLVISRTLDTTIAARVAASLKTDKFTTIRIDHHLYDITVFIGSDYKERIQ